jgi:hypothetical protein
VEALFVKPRSQIVISIRNLKGELELDASNGNIMQIGKAVDRERLYARDGNGLLLIVDGISSIRIIDPVEGTIQDLGVPPFSISSVTGCHSGGFWVTNTLGHLYLLSPLNGFRRITEVGLSHVSRSVVLTASDMLLWWGTCIAELNQGQTHVVVFFQWNPKNGELLEIGRRFFESDLGRLTALTWNHRAQRLVAFFQRPPRPQGYPSDLAQIT